MSVKATLLFLTLLVSSYAGYFEISYVDINVLDSDKVLLTVECVDTNTSEPVSGASYKIDYFLKVAPGFTCGADYSPAIQGSASCGVLNQNIIPTGQKLPKGSYCLHIIGLDSGGNFCRGNCVLDELFYVSSKKKAMNIDENGFFYVIPLLLFLYLQKKRSS